MAEYEVAQEAKLIADRLINDYHTRLKGQRVEYLFLVEKPKKKPQLKESPGDVKVISGLGAFLAGGAEDPYPEPFFVLLFRRHVWRRVEDERLREALVDWFLCRCGFDEKTGAPKKLDYDVSGYRANVERYGPWHDELRDFLKAAGQYELPLPDAGPGAGRAPARRTRRAGKSAAARA